jgi:hypothetical protein
MTGGLRKLHNKELHNLYSSPTNHNVQVKDDEMGRTFRTHVEEGKSIQDFGCNTRRKETTRKI